MITIKEEFIEKVTIDDGNAQVTLIKDNKEDMRYRVVYSYAESYLQDGETYCSYCGAFFPIGESCPECSEQSQEERTQYIDCSGLEQYIHQSLAEDCTVTVKLFDIDEETVLRL